MNEKLLQSYPEHQSHACPRCSRLLRLWPGPEKVDWQLASCKQNPKWLWEVVSVLSVSKLTFCAEEVLFDQKIIENMMNIFLYPIFRNIFIFSPRCLCVAPAAVPREGSRSCLLPAHKGMMMVVMVMITDTAVISASIMGF